jgi:hypothetical protein
VTVSFTHCAQLHIHFAAAILLCATGISFSSEGKSVPKLTGLRSRF